MKDNDNIMTTSKQSDGTSNGYLNFGYQAIVAAADVAPAAATPTISEE